MASASAAARRLGAGVLCAGAAAFTALSLYAIWLAPDVSPALVAARVFPLPFFVVGYAVLFQRLQDRHAWLLALLFTGFLVFTVPAEGDPAALAFMRVFRMPFYWLTPAFFLFFFAGFPAQSPLDRRVPWLKWLVLATGVVLLVARQPWLAGSSRPPGSALAAVVDREIVFLLELLYSFGALALGLAALVANGLRPPDADSRRRTRVLIWGTVAGFAPFFLAMVASGGRLTTLPVWTVLGAVLGLWVVPVAFAYSVIRHRVLEIPVLLRRSARYLLVQRGFAVIGVALTLALAWLFASAVPLLLPSGSDLGIPVTLLSATAFGAVLARGGASVARRVTERIDRAFFRRAYDARQILEDLAEQTRAATSRRELADLLDRQLRDALMPVTLAIYLRQPGGRLAAAGGEAAAPDIGAATTVDELARRGRALAVPAPVNDFDELLECLAPLGPECLVPLAGRDRSALGLIVVGGRLSEEPYGGEDRRLLSAVAAQAAAAIEAIEQGEQIAQQMEAERRAEREVEIARDVQRQLLPQHQPDLVTLEYAAGCVQARGVGGDFYDFIDLASGRLGLVLADVAGKGIPAALLMANLQAHLRSQCALQPDDPAAALVTVNGRFLASTPGNRYATLVFAAYDDSCRTLTYVNCGHPPPLVVRADGRVESLDATASVIGLFAGWECASARVAIDPGDLLIICSDGVTEAMSDEGVEFGEDRLREIVLRDRQAPLPALLERFTAEVLAFSGASQKDDLTIVLARGR